MTLSSRPLPTSSSMYSHRNCITKMKMVIARIAKNGPMNDFSMNRSSFFMRFLDYARNDKGVLGMKGGLRRR